MILPLTLTQSQHCLLNPSQPLRYPCSIILGCHTEHSVYLVLFIQSNLFFCKESVKHLKVQRTRVSAPEMGQPVGTRCQGELPVPSMMVFRPSHDTNSNSIISICSFSSH